MGSRLRMRSYERALALGLDAAFDETMNAEVRLHLGEALQEMHREPERARELLEQARAAYDAMGDAEGAARAAQRLD